MSHHLVMWSQDVVCRATYTKATDLKAYSTNKNFVRGGPIGLQAFFEKKSVLGSRQSHRRKISASTGPQEQRTETPHTFEQVREALLVGTLPHATTHKSEKVFRDLVPPYFSSVTLVAGR